MSKQKYINANEFEKYYKDHSNIDVAKHFDISKSKVQMIAKQLGLTKKRGSKQNIFVGDYKGGGKSWREFC